MPAIALLMNAVALERRRQNKKVYSLSNILSGVHKTNNSPIIVKNVMLKIRDFKIVILIYLYCIVQSFEF